jgi:hypothetical protein
MPDGMLCHLRDTYPVETAWAPHYVGDELRQVRAAAWDARLASLRADADSRAARQRGDRTEAAHTTWRAATRRCTRPTGSARRCSPPPWPTGPSGMPLPAPSATRPWLPMPNCAAATLASTTRRCGPANPSPPPMPDATSSPRLRTSRPTRCPRGSRRWQLPTAALPSGSRTGRAWGSPLMTPTTATTARRFRPGRDRQGRDLATAQARDPAVPGGPPARRRPRRRLVIRRLTAAGMTASLANANETRLTGPTAGSTLRASSEAKFQLNDEGMAGRSIRTSRPSLNGTTPVPLYPFSPFNLPDLDRPICHPGFVIDPGSTRCHAAPGWWHVTCEVR